MKNKVLDQKYKPNSRTHVALLVAKMFKKPFTVEDMESISVLFSNRKSTSQSMNLLKKWGFITKVEDKWCITEAGVDHLYRTAKTYVYGDSQNDY
jgi:hypothetical protein